MLHQHTKDSIFHLSQNVHDSCLHGHGHFYSRKDKQIKRKTNKGQIEQHSQPQAFKDGCYLSTTVKKTTYMTINLFFPISEISLCIYF